ncbi:hypothetical protein [Sandarakinorhabdus sp.]|uniref:hypothetical protein n=1 Tax=Sandarakinorhabdus sp. TaxID=1916663 RepID=UPI00333ECC11
MTAAISLQQARGLVAAAAHAERIGLPPNRLVTLHWAALGLGDDLAAAAIGRVLKLWREALAERGLPFACVWARENDDGDASKGSHVHILAHVPAAAGPGFMRRLRGWARLAAGGRIDRRRGRIDGPAYVAGAVNTRRIGGRLVVAQGVHEANLAAALGYLLKGADEATAAALGLTRREPGGRLTGKRVGWSENIGAKARRRVE